MYCDCCNDEYNPEQLFLDSKGRKLCSYCFAKENYDDLLDYCDDYITDYAEQKLSEEVDDYDPYFDDYNYYVNGVNNARCEDDYLDILNDYIREIKYDIDLSDFYEEFAEEYSSGRVNENNVD